MLVSGVWKTLPMLNGLSLGRDLSEDDGLLAFDGE